MKRALITTVYSPVGGVTTITEAAATMLEGAGWNVRLAYYMPWSKASNLSVRLCSRGNVGSGWRVRPWEGNENYKAYEIGVRFPELEWRRYELNDGWKRAIADHDIHLTVSGNILPAGPVIDAGKPCLAWVATCYWPDKRDRIREYAWPRRIFDSLVNTPVCMLKERHLAREANVLALSRYTASEMASSVGISEPPVMSMGVDTEVYRPLSGTDESGDAGSQMLVGFVGRLTDPRKNVAMLADVLKILRCRGLDVSLELAGGQPSQGFLNKVEELGLSQHVEVRGRVTSTELVKLYNRLDLFLLPSQQEGLGIVGLEAMACGCPVISTRCGGPEDYVQDGVNGFLVGFDAGEMAHAVERVIEDRYLRREMARKAVETVRNGYRRADTERIFWREFASAFEQPGEWNG